MASPSSHPARRSGIVALAIGASFLMLGALRLGNAHTFDPLEVPLIAFGAWLAATGVRLVFVAPLVLLVNRSVNVLRMGRVDEARALLDEVESRRGRRFLRRPVWMQRAELALRDGHLDEALALYERASALPVAWNGALFDRAQRAEAYASLALLKAGRGDAAGARQASAAALVLDLSESARARVALAELMLLSSEGDRDRLIASFEENRSLLYEATLPRERALVRALDRMLFATRPSAYRVPSPPVVPPGEMTSWVARFAPTLAPYVVERGGSQPTGAGPAFATPTAEASAELDRRDRAASRAASPLARRQRWILAFAGLSVAYATLLFITQRGATATQDRYVAHDADPATALTYLVPSAVVFGTFAFLRARAQRRQRASLRQLRDVGLALARGDYARARELLPALAKHPDWSFRAQAALHLAAIEEREGELEKALAACDRALGIAGGPTTRAAAYDFLLPGIHAERAFVLAGLGRADEAVAEVTRLERDFPAFVGLAQAQIRVKLALLARDARFPEAAQLGHERPVHLPLGRREELLFDLADLFDRNQNDDLRVQYRAQVDRDVPLRSWLEAFAPGVVDRLRKPLGPPAAEAP